jgi:phage shock protein PspC (stress-responsive transcriptional regulator)
MRNFFVKLNSGLKKEGIIMIGLVVFVSILIACLATGILLRKFRFIRDSESKMIGGVCAGLAKTMEIQPFWVRLGFVLSNVFIGYGLGLYIILWIVLPEE